MTKKTRTQIPAAATRVVNAATGEVKAIRCKSCGKFIPKGLSCADCADSPS